MNLNDSTKTTKNSLSFLSLKFGAMALFIGLLFTIFSSSHRQYSSGNLTVKENDKDEDAKGMIQWFFSARRNPVTNALDVPSMLAASMADRAMAKAPIRHSSATPLPEFNWFSVGPTGTGGRTRAILIDRNDPSHQTIFAGGVTGGIWKSTDGGSHWDNSFATICRSLNDFLPNINVCCIAQDNQGAIYIGTGEGFSFISPEYSTGELGGGIFKSTDDGATWRLLPSTDPTASNDPSVNFAYTNRIAINPNNPQEIWVGTGQASTNGGGIYVSHDSGAHWYVCWSNLGKKLTESTLDVKISTDGSVIVADIGGNPYYCYPSSDTTFTEMNTNKTTAGFIPGSASRIEFAISPTDPNRIYCSDINNSDNFGNPSGASSGIFMTETAKTNGGYWYEIGPGGSNAFDPYISAQDQCDYDNTLAVFPNNEGYLLVGGTTLYKWFQTSPSDTVGEWSKISHYQPYYSGDPLWIHADEHALVFDLNNTNTLFIGCDGGIFKSTNATNAETTSGYMTYTPYNRNYDVTQYYTVCFSPEVNYVTVNDSSSSMLQGLGVGGGTQDNGSPYINGGGYYPNDGTDMSGGDGAGSVVSTLNPNIAYFCADYGTLLREGNLGALSFPSSAWTSTIGKCEGADIDSIAAYCTANYASDFVFPVALYENIYDTYNHDSVIYITTTADTAGTVIWPNGTNGSYPYVLPVNKPANDTFNVPDRVVSRLAVGFDGAHGIWMNGQAAGNSTIIWMPIAGPLSKPDAMSGPSIHALAWTPDGNALFAGNDGGGVYRLLNINKVLVNDYCSGALWYEEGGQHATKNTAVECKALTVPQSNGRNILSIAVDPQDGNNVLFTMGGYNGTSLSYVYLTTNALDTVSTPSFTDEQGNLPLMPVYGAILDIKDTGGHWLPGSAMVATEHGVYTTDSLAGSKTIWVKNSKGMSNGMCLAIKQQTAPNWMCNNSGDIYVGSHGRGIWVASDNYQAPTAVPAVSTKSAMNDLKIYPNPMTTEGNIEFDLSSADNVTIEVYNIEGKQVKTMNLGQQAPGNHIIPFNSSDLQAGTYFASLTGSDFKKVSKFIVVK